MLPSACTQSHPVGSPRRILEARSARLLELEARFAAHSKRFPAEWCDYGPDDPVQDAGRWVNRCADCGAVPTLHADGTRFHATCCCGAQGLPAKMRWQAWLHWNRGPASAKPAWHSTPFFYLAGLDPTAARDKLRVLREHLELRANLEGTRRVIGESVSGLYLQRLKAYLGWCMYIQELLKQQAPR